VAQQNTAAGNLDYQTEVPEVGRVWGGKQAGGILAGCPVAKRSVMVGGSASQQAKRASGGDCPVTGGLIYRQEIPDVLPRKAIGGKGKQLCRLCRQGSGYRNLREHKATVLRGGGFWPACTEQ
jgi:hypothetical protein